MEWLSKLGNIIERVRTPLALAGLMVVLLYALYSQILKMDVFSKVSSRSTFVLIDRILLYVFILAILAVVLGGFGYFLSKRRSKSKGV